VVLTYLDGTQTNLTILLSKGNNADELLRAKGNMPQITINNSWAAKTNYVIQRRFFAAKNNRLVSCSSRLFSHLKNHHRR